MKPNNLNPASDRAKVLGAIEQVEGTRLTNLRRLFESYFERMTSIKIETPTMLKIALLHKGTKSVKKAKGAVVDIVSKRHEWHESTVEGEPIKLLFLNERLGLTNAATPRSNTEAIRRYIGAMSHAYAEAFIERKLNARGVPINDTNYNNQLDRLGFRKWDLPSSHAEQFISLVASKVTLPVEAFEIADPPKKDGPRKVYRGEIRHNGKVLCNPIPIPKGVYDTYRDKVAELTMTFIEVDPTALARANKAAKDVEKDNREKLSAEDKLAREAELTKLAESVEDVELLS